MGRREELEAELAYLELGERMVALKQDPNADPAEVQRVKLEHREATRQFRSLRDGLPLEVAAGDAVARPATIKAKAGVKGPGGKG